MEFLLITLIRRHFHCACLGPFIFFILRFKKFKRESVKEKIPNDFHRNMNSDRKRPSFAVNFYSILISGIFTFH